jgi:glycosyltransferase involved in cell wall biosynthesis
MFLDPGVSGGPETYLHALGDALVREFSDVRFEVATTRRGAAALRAAGGWATEVGIRELPADEGQRLRRLFAEQVLLPRLAMRARWDVLHSVASVAPVRPRVPAAITVHDVTFLRIRTFPRSTTLAMGTIMRLASRRADALVVISQATRDEVAEEFGLDPDALSVVPNGPGSAPVEAAPETGVRTRYRLDDDKRIVLCVNAKRPHKNQEVLVRAVPLLPDDHTLVLAGRAEAYELRLRMLATELGVEERVRFVGRVPDQDLEALMRLAACVAVPSLAEGFGLPVLEAMQRGVPVAASDIPVLHEVGGDAARYFDPRDPRAAAAAIRSAAGDPALREAGRARAGRFSWEATARGTFEAYERALAARGR